MNEIKNFYDKIDPKTSPEEMSARIIAMCADKAAEKQSHENHDDHESHVSFRKPALALVAAVCAATFTVSASASGGVSVIISSMFGGSSHAYDMLETAIFHDEDGNVSFDVDEVISDGMCTYATVHYTALNDEGKKWLNTYDILYSYKHIIKEGEGSEEIPNLGYCFEGSLTLAPYGSHDDFSNWMLDNGNLNYHEWIKCHYEGSVYYLRSSIANKSTETERYFYVSVELAKKDSAGNELDLYYPMTNDTRITQISTRNDIKEKLLVIKPERDGEKYYIPTSIRISAISATLYGSFTDRIYTFQGIGRKMRVKPEEYTHFVNNTYLVMKDGSKLYFSRYDMPRGEVANDNPYSRFVLLSSRYQKRVGEDISPTSMENEHIFIDPDDVIGIQIEDHYYELIDG